MRLIKSSLILVLVFATTDFITDGQTPAPKVGYIRFWDMIPAQNGDFQLSKVSGGENGGGSLLSGTAYRYTSYAEFPAMSYHLGVFKKTNPKTPMKVFDINLLPATFYTVLVTPLNGTINVEVINDSIDPKASTGRLTIRNYFPALTVSVSAGDQKVTDGLAYGRSYSTTGFPLSRVPLKLRTTLPTGTPAESDVEADFTASKHWTLLVIPDSYGRFRPRITADGKNL